MSAVRWRPDLQAEDLNNRADHRLDVEEIGKGTHERMVVDLRRLTKRLDGLDFGCRPESQRSINSQGTQAPNLRRR